MTKTTQSKLNILVFLGSVRTSTPPRPARIGERVAKYCITSLSDLGHVVTLVDPLQIETRKNASDKVFKPHFSYAENKAPEDLQELAAKIEHADAYVMISPEYNHSMSPALADLLNHFGSSLFSYKPSAIVTYSAGQWGGARAAVAMRAFLSELGCLPVSAMIHLPRAQEIFDVDGRIAPDQNSASWNTYFGRTWAQVFWWAQAAKNQKDLCDPTSVAAAFKSSPAERNAGHKKG
jgi:NAD(P)H-dependent FMN reductase